MAEPKCRLAIIACIALTIALPVRAAGQVEAELVPEPGFVDGDGSWVVPVSLPSPAGTIDFDGLVFKVERDEQRLSLAERLAFPLTGTSGPASALAVLMDAPPLTDEVAAAWRRDLESLVRKRAASGGATVLARCGPDQPLTVAARDGELAPDEWSGLFEKVARARLWDGVLAALTALAADDRPERRVLLVVSDGHEEVASRLVMKSCVEAALRARIAVYVVSMATGGDGDAGGARLKELARSTGGRLIGPEVESVDRLGAMLALLSAVRGLRLQGSGGALPAEVRIMWSDGRVTAEVAERQALRGSGGGRWLIAGAALLAAAGGGFLVWRQRSVVVGEFLIQTAAGAKRFPLPRHGVTIGRDKDSNMRLNNRLVSRHHAVVRIKDGAAIMTDLRSARGTTVNGEPIRTRKLASGDQIRIAGSVELVYQSLAAKAGHKS